MSFAGFECLFHVLLSQALFYVDYTREYGICSSLSAGTKYRDMRKAVGGKAVCVEDVFRNIVALLLGDGCCS